MDIQLEQKVAKKYVKLKQSATDRGIEFNMSLSDLKKILNAKKCYYTGIPISTWHDNENDNKLTIDRVDNNKGYITGNIVACSHTFNQLKGKLSLEDIKILHDKCISGE